MSCARQNLEPPGQSQQHQKALTTLAGSALAGGAKTAPKLGLHMTSVHRRVSGLVSSPWGLAAVRAESPEQRLGGS